MDKEKLTEMKRTNPFSPVWQSNEPFSSTQSWARDNESEARTNSHREYSKMPCASRLGRHAPRRLPDEYSEF